MYIKFNKLSAQNFMSIGNTPIELDLSKNEKVLISGKNGNGKSSILSAITYALFGRAYSKANKSSLINSINNKACLVALEFYVDDILYKVERGMKPNVFKIYKNNILIDQSSASKDYQLILEEIIKIDFKTYTQSIMMGSMSYVPFLQLSAPDRRAFIENLLDIDVFTKMNKVLKLKAQKNQNEINDVKSNLLATNKSIDIINSVLENLQSDTTTKLEKLNEEIKDKIKEYRDTETKIDELNSSLELLVVDDNKVEETRTAISKFSSLILSKESDATRLRKNIKFFDTTPTCMQCGQDVDPEHKDKHLKEYNTELDTIGSFIIKAKRNKDSLESQLQEYNKILTKKRLITTELSTLTTKQSYIKQDLSKKAIEKKSLESTNSNELIVDNTNKLQKEKLIQKELEEKYNELLKIKSAYDKIALALKDSGAKADIIKNYIPKIVTLVNKYLEKLNLYVKFNLDEEFNETLKSRHTDEFQYESFSMGERTRINFAMLFTWWEITKIRKGIHFNILCADEVLENLDEEGVTEILSVTDTIQNLGVYVVSHKSGLEVLFDKVLQVTKVKGFTRLSELK